jgi:hypothetical protein
VRYALRVPTYLGLALVYAYRWSFGVLSSGSCKYHPTCSQYALDALRRYGLVRGSILAGWRLLRCNPWSRGGVDYAEDQRLFGHGGTPGSPVSPLLFRAPSRRRAEAAPSKARLRRRFGAGSTKAGKP